MAVHTLEAIFDKSENEPPTNSCQTNKQKWFALVLELGEKKKFVVGKRNQNDREEINAFINVIYKDRVGVEEGEGEGGRGRGVCANEDTMDDSKT